MDKTIKILLIILSICLIGAVIAYWRLETLKVDSVPYTIEKKTPVEVNGWPCVEPCKG